MTLNPGSDSSSMRRPHLKIGWSSAIRIRTGLRLSAMRPVRKTDFKAGATIGGRINRERAADAAHALFDDCRTSMRRGELGMRNAATESEPAPIVCNQQHLLPFALLGKTNESVPGAAMPSYI